MIMEDLLSLPCVGEHFNCRPFLKEVLSQSIVGVWIGLLPGANSVLSGFAGVCIVLMCMCVYVCVFACILPVISLGRQQSNSQSSRQLRRTC